MGSVTKLLHDYGVGRKKHEAHKKNQNPSERRIQDIKVNTRTILIRSGAPSLSWILCMSSVVSIINCMAHHSLSWRNPHEAAYGFTPDVAH